MSRESDLLFGLLALQMNFISKERLLECAAVCMNDPAREMGRLLLERGHLKDFQHAGVAAMVEAQLRTNGGDPAKTLARAPMDDDTRDTLRTIRMPPPEFPEKSSLPHPSPAEHDRYRVGAKLGEGGLGEVVEAFDSSLERDVALKLIRGGASSDLTERFVRESKLAGGLEHPNIVPVYDFGTVVEGKQRLFLAMKRVKGRDLGKVLAALAAGDAATRAAYSRTRLLQIFQDICLGMAYAHDRGVIHRDLKPANVMLGDYGEVYIVDWGLARFVTAAEAPARKPGRVSDTSANSQFTLDGEIMGTPAYMPPEQAEGRMPEMDRRSDVYSLGAILHEILTLRPPFEGKTAIETIKKVKAGGIAAPSTRAPLAVPPELDAICLRALAHRPGDRFQSVLDLHHDIQLFLEGVKEREREHRLAEESVARAKVALERHTRLGGEARAASEAAEKLGKRVQPWDPDKAGLWAEQDRAAALERGAVEALAEADAELTAALSQERNHAEARRMKAELAWSKFVEAEERGDAKEMVLLRRIAEQFNDGPLDALLKGDGTLSVRARAYSCNCLLEGRSVPPEDLVHMGHHPFSARPLDGHRASESLPQREPASPVRLKVHGPGCVLKPVEGAEVWLYRYEETGRRLIPVTPAFRASKGSEPKAALDALFPADSPFRPRGPGLFLGPTPIAPTALPMGSYLLVLARDGFEPIRCPVVIPRCGACEPEVTLWRAGEIPDGFVPVPAGPFIWQGDPKSPTGGPAKTKFVGDFFILRHPVTAREYCDYLNDLVKTDPAQAARRVPRESQESGPWWPCTLRPERAERVEGPYAVPTAAWLAAAPPSLRATVRRLPGCEADWEEDWPVLGLSWDDALAYCAWRRAREGNVFVVPHEVEWEKSARGADTRIFPWGREMNETWANTNRSLSAGMRPVRIQEFPGDESPFGVRGLCGNSRDVCLNDPGPEYPAWRMFRGGGWGHSNLSARIAMRSGASPTSVHYHTGFRLVMAPVCPDDSRTDFSL